MSVTNARESHAIKKKGCDFQEEIVEKILNKIPSLTVFDVVSCPPSAKGEDAQISNDARKVLPIVVECKHYDKGFGQVYKYYREAHKHMRELGRADNIDYRVIPSAMTYKLIGRTSLTGSRLDCRSLLFSVSRIFAGGFNRIEFCIHEGPK